MAQLTLFGEEVKKLINLREASVWASQYLNREVTISNISYLLQYGRIRKYGSNGSPLINIEELKEYYDALETQEKQWKKKLGEDLNWHLSFVE
ncbi:MAG: site-specific DNA-methyltransferase, partial [Candidatus Thorarchaeota archaeon]